MNFSILFIVFFNIFLFLVVFSPTEAQRTALDNPLTIYLYRLLKDTILNVHGHTGDLRNPARSIVQARLQIQPQVPEDEPFPCNTTNGRSKNIPTSVHKLRPGDIDIIGAMGDSLTAGFGIMATNFVNAFIENRGAQALGGGMYTWREYITLPNLLKEYNPNLYGYATDDAYSYQPASHFNVGENFAMSRDMPFMARNLVERMKNDPKVDLKNHWKLISFFIGCNDMCSDVCYVNPPSRALENHRRDLIESFRILRDNLPRTIVLLIPIPSLRKRIFVNGKPPVCKLIAGFACSCFVGRRFESREDEMRKLAKDWQKVDLEVSLYPEFQTDDFSVSFQEFTATASSPAKPNGDIDLRYFSVDCFHFSQHFNSKMALSAWKSLFEPFNNKSRGNFKTIQMTCPPEDHPYIVTPKNSL